MEEKMIIELTFDEAICLKRCTSVFIMRQGCGSARRRRALRLQQLRKQYDEQRNLDAVCLAANGGKTDLLSGRSSKLRRAISNMAESNAHIERQIKTAAELRERLRAMAALPASSGATILRYDEIRGRSDCAVVAG